MSAQVVQPEADDRPGERGYDRGMSAPPPLPLLRRIPPGLWAALVWFTTAVQPVIEYVVMPPQQGYSSSYPEDGLDALDAKALLGLAFVMVLVGSVTLRRRTEVAYGLIVAGTVVSSLAWRQDEIPSLQFLGTDIALGYLAATRPRRSSLTAAAAALTVLASYAVLRPVLGDDSGTAAEPFVALTVVIAWLLGNSVRQTRAHTEELYARAAAQAVTAERLRIAREMHDLVAHSIGIIALQAGAAARVVETQPARAREAMFTVEKAGRETLSGLRRMLGALRAAEEEQESADLQPAPGLVDMERLAAATTDAGVRVEVRWQGRRRPLAPEIDLAAFRIIQESVTNVVRHSGADSCRVSIEYDESGLAVEISDRGEGTGNSVETGYGLAGMRERSALLHGEFTAGPRPGGGFLVAARLPAPAEIGTEVRTGTG